MTKKLFFGILAFTPITILIMIFLSIIVAGENWREFWWSTLGVISFIITAIFMANVPINKSIEKGKKTLWLALIFFGNIWVTPFYWWFHLRKIA